LCEPQESAGRVPFPFSWGRAGVVRHGPAPLSRSPRSTLKEIIGDFVLLRYLFALRYAPQCRVPLRQRRLSLERRNHPSFLFDSRSAFLVAVTAFFFFPLLRLVTSQAVLDFLSRHLPPCLAHRSPRCFPPSTTCYIDQSPIFLFFQSVVPPFPFSFPRFFRDLPPTALVHSLSWHGSFQRQKGVFCLSSCGFFPKVVSAFCPTVLLRFVFQARNFSKLGGLYFPFPFGCGCCDGLAEPPFQPRLVVFPQLEVVVYTIPFSFLGRSPLSAEAQASFSLAPPPRETRADTPLDEAGRPFSTPFRRMSWLADSRFPPFAGGPLYTVVVTQPLLPHKMLDCSLIYGPSSAGFPPSEGEDPPQLGQVKVSLTFCILAQGFVAQACRLELSLFSTALPFACFQRLLFLCGVCPFFFHFFRPRPPGLTSGRRPRLFFLFLATQELQGSPVSITGLVFFSFRGATGSSLPFRLSSPCPLPSGKKQVSRKVFPPFFLPATLPFGTWPSSFPFF